MKTNRHFAAWSTLVVPLLATIPGLAQKADPYAYSIQVYQLPASELITGFVSEKKGRLRAPNLPPLRETRASCAPSGWRAKADSARR